MESIFESARLPYVLIILGFVFIHIISKYVGFRESNIRKVISFSGGVGITYVVINMLPYLPYSQALLNKTFGWAEDSLFRYVIYTVVLLGLALAYTLHKLDKREVKKLQKIDPEKAKSFLFWSNAAFFALYNAMIGYIVGSGALSQRTNRLVYFSAFSLHFFMNDSVMRHHYTEKYDKFGWIVLAASVYIGGMFALIFHVPDYLVVLFKALITGAMILVVIRFELPQDNKSSLKWFWLGTVCSAALFLVL